MMITSLCNIVNYANTSVSPTGYSAKTKRDGQTDRRTDRQGHCNISRPGPSAPREIITYLLLKGGIFNNIMSY